MAKMFSPGRDPIAPPDKKNFDRMVKNLGPAPALLVPGSTQVPKELLNIDSDVLSEVQVQSARFRKEIESFRFWQVEQLLNQASDLLERCLRHRAEYDDLKGKWFRLALEGLEFDELNEIHEDETTAGWYSIEFDQSKPIRDSEESNLDASTAALSKYKEAANVPSYVADAVDVAWVSGFSNYRDEHNNHNPNNQNTEKKNDLRAAVSYHTGRILARDSAVLGAQLELTNGSAGAGKHRLAALDAKAKWDQENIDFQRRRTRVGALMNEIRKYAMAQSGAPYNYLEQLNQVRSHFIDDFRDAYLRLSASKIGLEAIYGVSIPDFPGKTKDNEPDAWILDQCVSWARRATMEMISFAHLDQNYIFTVSLRRLVGKDRWDKLKKDAQKEKPLIVEFELTEDLFPDQRHIRLRGISLSVDQSEENDAWVGTIRPPNKGLCRLMKDNSVNELDQVDAPRCRSGRISSRSAKREADVIGLTTFHNLSPVGFPKASASDRTWTLVLDHYSLAENEVVDVRDVFVDLYLAIRMI